MTAAYAHLSAAQQALLQRSETLARDVLAPIAAAGAAGHVNRELVAALAAQGLLPDLLEPGRDIRAVDLCVMREGLARFSTDAESALALQALGAHPILASAQAAIAKAWIPRIARGEAVAAFALTEPGAGSDVAALAMAAEPDGDGYRLSGEKVFISNAPDADVYTVFGRTARGDGSRGITAFAVPRDSAGLSGAVTRLMSDHPIGRLTFDGVAVPASHVLGEVGGGFGIAMRTLDLFRPSVGAAAVGMAQAALDAAVTHASQREAFGRPLSMLQGVTHQLADVAMRIQAARLLVHSAAAAQDQGLTRLGAVAAMAKLFATETAALAVDVAIQVHGARALEQGHLLEHLYREVRGPRIYEGASEVQREIIARSLFRT